MLPKYHLVTTQIFYTRWLNINLQLCNLMTCYNLYVINQSSHPWQPYNPSLTMHCNTVTLIRNQYWDLFICTPKCISLYWLHNWLIGSQFKQKIIKQSRNVIQVLLTLYTLFQADVSSNRHWSIYIYIKALK